MSVDIDALNHRVYRLEADLAALKKQLGSSPDPLPFPVRLKISSYIPASGIHCSFCGKDKEEVAQIIAGPGNFICDECVDLCHKIIEEKRNPRQAEKSIDDVLGPSNIKDEGQ